MVTESPSFTNENQNDKKSQSYSLQDFLDEAQLIKLETV